MRKFTELVDLVLEKKKKTAKTPYKDKNNNVVSPGDTISIERDGFKYISTYLRRRLIREYPKKVFSPKEGIMKISQKLDSDNNDVIDKNTKGKEVKFKLKKSVLHKKKLR